MHLQALGSPLALGSMRARPLPCVQQPALAPSICHKARLRPISCRAAEEDPYQVLGIKPDAEPIEITRAYNIAKSRNRGNPAILQKVETAHGKLMMMAFNARLKVRRRRICMQTYSCIHGFASFAHIMSSQQKPVAAPDMNTPHVPTCMHDDACTIVCGPFIDVMSQ